MGCRRRTSFEFNKYLLSYLKGCYVGDDDETFVSFVTSYNTQVRPQVMELLEKYACKDIFVFSDRDQASAFLQKLQ